MRKFLLSGLLVLCPALSFAGVVSASSSVAVTATPASPAYGSPITLAATVVDQNGNPLTNGAVTFYDGNVRLGTVQVASTALAGGVPGTATLTTFLTQLGSNSITATYAGAGAASASAPVTVTVTGLYPAAAALTASGSAGNYSLTATVLGASPVAPTGSVVFTDSTTGLEIGAASFNSSSPAQTFTVAAATGVTAPQAAALDDVNGDGILDLVTGSASGLFVQLGNGDGSFRAPVQVSSSSVSPAATFGLLPGASMVFGDFNGDGKIDIAFVSCAGSNCAVGVLPGNGDGTFLPERDFDQGETIAAIAAGDFNGDGILDLAVAKYGNGTVDILPGNGDGSFQTPLTTSMPGASSIAAADLNGDGMLDLVVSSWSAATVSVLTGKGDGTFQAAQPYATGANPSNVILADLRGIGRLDIVNLDANGSVSALLANGDGSFQPATPVFTASSESVASLAVADVNGDGRQDLVVSDQAGNAVDVLAGNGDGTFEGPVSYSTGAAPHGVAVGDLNHDGLADIAVASQTANSTTILLNQVTQTATLSNAAIPGKGTHSVVAAYSGDANFAASTSNPVQLAAALATPSMSLAWLPAATLAWGQALSLSVALAGPSATLPTPTGTASYSIDKGSVRKVNLAAGAVTVPISQLAVGAHSISVTYGGDCYYAALPAQTLAVNVDLALPVISWPAPADLPYGKALNGVQLNATANTAGTFAYSPAAGTVLAAGSQTLSVTFTPTNASVYVAATATVTLTVNPATPGVSWSAPAAIPYGTALSATQLDASSPIAGTFAYSPAAGAILTAGWQTLSVTFTPTDATDYNSATATVKLDVSAAKPAITWATPAPIASGTALSATQLNASSPPAGTFVYTPASGTVLAPGAHILSVAFTPADSTDYTTATGTVTELVGPGISTQPANAKVVFGQSATFKVCASGAAPVTYQWQYLNGSTWRPFGAGAGYTTATLTTFPTTAMFGGAQLRVVVTDGNGLSAASNAATLTVTPAILTQPVSQTVAFGASATFSVAVGGVGNLTYQWQYLNGSTWMPFGAGTGYNTATVTTFPTTAAFDRVQFRVVATDGNGFTVTSCQARLLVAPAILAAPFSQTVAGGSAAVFTVSATGLGSLSYTWQYWNGSAWVTFTPAMAKAYFTATLTTVPATAALNGLQLRVQVTGNGTTATSAPVTLIVTPGITQQPTRQTVPVNWSATFSVTVVGVPNLIYQWQYLDGANWTPFCTGSGYDAAIFTTVNNPLASNGTQVRAVITDGQGLTVTSKAVTLTVIL